MKPITIRQLAVYDALANFIKKNGYSPSVMELCKATGLKSKSTIFGHLETLRSKEYVTWVESQARTFQIIKDVTPEDRERLKIKYAFAY